MDKSNYYNTKIYTDVWKDVDSFIQDYLNNPLKGSISEDSARKLYWLLYARYGNSPIANRDVNQYKVKVFSIIFEYGATWEKKLFIQERIRNLSEEEIMLGAKTIMNHANNPSEEPYTENEESLHYIDEQNATTSKRGKLDSYMNLWGLLEDVTETFITKFKICFKMVVGHERPVLYTED